VEVRPSRSIFDRKTLDALVLDSFPYFPDKILIQHFPKGGQAWVTRYTYTIDQSLSILMQLVYILLQKRRVAMNGHKVEIRFEVRSAQNAAN
jgi:hypothetical protein